MLSNRARSRPRRTNSARTRTKAVRSGVGSCAAKPQKRRNEARSSRASAKRTSERSCQVASRRARNRPAVASPAHLWRKPRCRTAGHPPRPSRSERPPRPAPCRRVVQPRPAPIAPARSGAVPWPLPIRPGQHGIRSSRTRPATRTQFSLYRYYYLSYARHCCWAPSRVRSSLRQFCYRRRDGRRSCPRGGVGVPVLGRVRG